MRGPYSTLTEADLQPGDFNCIKFRQINAVEDPFSRIIKELNIDFRSRVKLEKSVFQLSMSKGKEAYRKAIEEQRAMTDGMPLPPCRYFTDGGSLSGK